jgi:hypothetical protein
MRTPAEDLAYAAALADADLWFAHSMTTVLLLTGSAAGGSSDFYSRGWPVFESSISRWLKTRREDLWEPVIEVRVRACMLLWSMWHVACGMWHVACGMWHACAPFCRGCTVGEGLSDGRTSVVGDAPI